jgi:hypothetical protein
MQRRPSGPKERHGSGAGAGKPPVAQNYEIVESMRRLRSSREEPLFCADTFVSTKLTMRRRRAKE